MRDLYLILALLLGAIGILGWYLSSQLKKIRESTIDNSRAEDLVNQVFGQVSDKVLQQAKVVFDGDKEAIYKDNASKQEAILTLVGDLKKELAMRQDELRNLERERSKNFGEISKSIEEHRKITSELKTSTEALSRTLSNNQVRGQWGERIIEDILTNAGLLESVHYEKQTQLGETSVRPDITLLLPNKRKVAVDVKFPYAAIQHMASAEGNQKQVYLKQFERDLKEKVGQIEKRGYINLEAGTLDYAIMFVPNEMLFSFINQQFPNIVDEAMHKKIMLVSPFTFLVVTRTIMESYRNFMIENNLRQIITHISQFVQEWERFVKDFDTFDGRLARLRDSFDTMRNTRFSRMRKRISNIESYKDGEYMIDTPEEVVGLEAE